MKAIHFFMLTLLLCVGVSFAQASISEQPQVDGKYIISIPFSDLTADGVETVKSLDGSKVAFSALPINVQKGIQEQCPLDLTPEQTDRLICFVVCAGCVIVALCL